MIPFKPHQNYTLLYVRATAGAAKDRIGEVILDPDQQAYLKVYVTTVAENGLANKAIINLLSKKFGIPKSNFKIIFGAIDKRKRILIEKPFNEITMLFKQVTGSLF